MKDERSYLLMVGRVVAVIISVILGVAIMSGCSTQKMAFRKVAWADYHHPEVVQEFCNETTITEVIKGDTFFVPGVEIPCPDPVVDTFIVEGETKLITRPSTVKCPPSMIITDTIYIEDKDKLNAKIHELKICTEAKNKAEGVKKTLTRNFTISAILNLLLACCCGLLLRLKKFL